MTTFEATAADQGNDAYAALRDGPPGRVLEVPVFRPGIHYGGVYLYYATQAPRQRPQGYSTLAPVEADELAKELAAVNCGDWTGRPAELLDRLGVTSVVFHEGLFRDNPAAPDTAAFAWEALVRHGFRPQAEDGPVTLLARRGGGPPPPSPVDDPPRDVAQFCDGWRPNDGEGRVTSARHASLWAYNAGGADLRLFLEPRGACRRPPDGGRSARARRARGEPGRDEAPARRRGLASRDDRRPARRPRRRLRAELRAGRRSEDPDQENDDEDESECSCAYVHEPLLSRRVPLPTPERPTENG